MSCNFNTKIKLVNYFYIDFNKKMIILFLFWFIQAVKWSTCSSNPLPLFHGNYWMQETIDDFQ